MGLFDWIFRRSPQSDSSPTARIDLAELSRRVGLSVDSLKSLPIKYHEYQIPKRSGGMRTIQSPDDQLKKVQQLILHRVLGRLRAHDVHMDLKLAVRSLPTRCRTQTRR